MKETLPFVSIITVNYNGRKFLGNCFKSLFNLNYPQNKLEIFMVDNGSTDDSIAFVKNEFPKIKIIINNVNNYCRANNLGIRHAKGKYIAILNNDTKAEKNWLIELVKAIESDKLLAAVGSKIISMDGKTESAGHQELPNFYWSDKVFNDYSQYDKPEEVNSLCGCAVLYRKSALVDVDYFDEDFNMYMEDVEISIRLARKKWKLLYAPESLVYHIHHGTAQEDMALFYTERNRLLLIAKYYPKKLCSTLLGRGYFTAQRDIKAQGSLYKVLADLVAKLIKHHKIEIVMEVLNELFIELKKISNYENSILVEKIDGFLRLVGSQEAALKGKDIHIGNLNQILKDKDEYLKGMHQEIEKRGQALKGKDIHIGNLNQILKDKDTRIGNLEAELAKKTQEIKDIYNSTAFRFLVHPLWAVLWNVKQLFRRLKIFNSSPHELITSKSKDNSINCGSDIQESAIGICTIISKNYLAYARVLADSFLEYNKGRIFVLLVDKIDGYFDPDKEKFTLVGIDSIKGRIPDFDKFSFQYNITELSTAVKPFFLEYLYDKFNLKKIIFFDPDILITHNLGDIFKLLEKFSIILIPHITRPYSDTCKPYELDILRSGVYNLGFIALSNRDSAIQLLGWWKERLLCYSKIDFQAGLFVDQKWIDLIPGFFEDVFILRDPTYNIAYWNLHYRKVYLDDKRILIDRNPVHFLHFSGLNPEDIDSISKHQDRFKLNDLRQMKPIFELYKNKLILNGYNITKNWPCIFNSFDNGAGIPDIVRIIYSEIGSKNDIKFGNPFNTFKKNSYFNWLNERIDNKHPAITRFMYEIYKKRIDLQVAYPDILGSGREGFFHWFLRSAGREYRLDKSFLEKIIPFKLKGKQQFVIRLETFAFYKARNLLKKFLKRIFKDNLWVINNLRIAELFWNRKIAHFSCIFTKKPEMNGKYNDKKGINVFGYLTAELGVGEAARANIKSLKHIGINFSLVNINNHSSSRKHDFSFSKFSEDNPHSINLIHVNADMFVKLYVEKGRGFFRDKYNIGFWNWELSYFPDEWHSSFNYCNEIWVPSSFTLISLANKSNIPVLKIPIAVIVDNLKSVTRSFFNLPEEEYIFLFIFDFFSYFERKNPLAIIEAFKKAFLPSEKVKLVIKCCNSSFSPQAMNSLKGSTKGYNIDIIDKYLYRDEVNTLIALCDCYISLHRSEGFGLTMAEAMFLGKPVIATGYSGNTDFMNINNSYLVRYKLVGIDKDIGPYKKGCVWAMPDVEHAAELMRFVYENKTRAQEIGKIAATDIRKNLNYDAIGAEIKNRLDYIYTNLA